MFSKGNLIAALCVLLSFVATAQVLPIPSGSPMIQSQIPRGQYKLSFGIPVVADTAHGLNGGLDSLGLLAMVQSTGDIWKRVVASGSVHKWQLVSSGGGTTYTPGPSISLDGGIAGVVVVPTMAKLQAFFSPGLSDSTIVFLGGFSAAHDGAEGFYNWSSTSTATPVRGMVIQPTGVTGAGRFIRLWSGSVLPADYMGVVHDGATFDSTNFQGAVDYAGSHGYSLLLSNGIYIMRNIHYNYHNFKMVGSGQTIIKAPVTDTTANAAIINCDGVNNIGIDNISFDGTLLKGSQAGGNPIMRFHTDSNVRITRVNIDSNAYTGMSFQQNCYNIDIGFFKIKNTDVGIHFIGNENGSSKINIHDGDIFGGTSECITFQGIGGSPPSASHGITLSNLHLSYKANSSGLYLLYCYDVQANNIEIDHCRAGIGGIPTTDRPDRTHDVTLTNINIHDVQNDGMGNLGKNFIGLGLTFKNIGREAMAVGNTDNDAFVDSNVHIAHVTADSINTAHSPNWGILRIKNCYNCTFEDIKGRFYSPNDTTTGVFAINLIGNSDSLLTISNCVFPDGQVLSRSNKTDNYVTFKDNLFKAINIGWAVVDSSTKQAVYLGNKYTGNPAKAITVNGSGFAQGINQVDPMVNYLMGSNLHVRSLEGSFIGRRIRLVSLANGNTVIHTKAGAAGNIHLKYGQDALLDTARYVELMWDGLWWIQTDGNTVVNYWPVGSDTVMLDTAGAKVKTDFMSGRIAIVGGGDDQLDNKRDSATNQSFRIAMPQYDAPKHLIGMMYGSSNSTANTLSIGGMSPNFYYNFQAINFTVANHFSIGTNIVMSLSNPDNALHIGSSGFNGTMNISTRKSFNDASGSAYIGQTKGIHASPSGSSESFSSLWLSDTIINLGNGMSSGLHVQPTLTTITGGYAGSWYDYTSGWNFYSASTNVPGWSAGGVRMGAGNSGGHASAQLDGNGTDKTKGWLPNIMTGAQMNAIVSPFNGLMVCCSDSGFAWCYYDGSAWRRSGYGLSGGGGLVNVRVGLIDSLSAVSNGAQYVNNGLYFQTATTNFPGMLDTARLRKIDSLGLRLYKFKVNLINKGSGGISLAYNSPAGDSLYVRNDTAWKWIIDDTTADGKIRHGFDSAAARTYFGNYFAALGSTSGGAGNAVRDTVTVTSGGFTVGEALAKSSSTWVAADTISNFADAVVSKVIDANTFELTYSGKVTWTSGLTIGSVAFSSTTAGSLTNTSPVISVPVGKQIATGTFLVAIKRPVDFSGSSSADSTIFRTNYRGDTVTANLRAQIAALGTSGTYVPVGVGTNHITAVSSDTSNWIRYGNIVVVYGSCTVSVSTLGGGALFEIPLPVPSHIGATTIAGYGSNNNTTLAGIVINGNGVTGNAQVSYGPSGTGPDLIKYSFSYRVY